MVPKKELPCFNTNVIKETNAIFQPIIVVPVNSSLPQDEPVILEIGAHISQKTQLQPNAFQLQPNSVQLQPNTEQLQQNNVADQSSDIVMENHKDSDGVGPGSQFLPVEGGYIVVDGMVVPGKLYYIIIYQTFCRKNYVTDNDFVPYRQLGVSLQCLPNRNI